MGEFGRQAAVSKHELSSFLVIYTKLTPSTTTSLHAAYISNNLVTNRYIPLSVEHSTADRISFVSVATRQVYLPTFT